MDISCVCKEPSVPPQRRNLIQKRECENNPPPSPNMDLLSVKYVTLYDFNYAVHAVRLS